MRRVGLAAVLLALAAASAAAQASDSQQAAPHHFDIDPVRLPSVREAPLHRPGALKTSDALSGLDLGGSRLNFESERRPVVSQSGAEAWEPGTMMTRKTRKLGPSYFGLSIKTPIE